MKDYKLSEIKKICEKHSTHYNRLCEKCQLRNGVCKEIENAPATWEIDEKEYKETVVVLTKEECDNKVILNEDHFERALNYEREKARKETASEILDMGKKLYGMSYHKRNAMPRLIEWIKVEYGVKVEEC